MPRSSAPLCVSQTSKREGMSCCSATSPRQPHHSQEVCRTRQPLYTYGPLSFVHLFRCLDNSMPNLCPGHARLGSRPGVLCTLGPISLPGCTISLSLSLSIYPRYPSRSRCRSSNICTAEGFQRRHHSTTMDNMSFPFCSPSSPPRSLQRLSFAFFPTGASTGRDFV
jgi:hypothetical protein